MQFDVKQAVAGALTIGMKQAVAGAPTIGVCVMLLNMICNGALSSSTPEETAAGDGEVVDEQVVSSVVRDGTPKELWSHTGAGTS